VAAPALPCTCFLLRKLARGVTQAYDRELAPAGLTVTQYSLLQHLRRAPGLSVSALGARMGMERTGLLRTLRPLIAAKYARYGEREAGRSAALEITAKGMERLRIATPLWQRAQDRLAQRLGTSGVRELQRSLEASLEALSEEAAA
jgi:DNA-binding MarR family transcriptional regulator